MPGLYFGGGADELYSGCSWNLDMVVVGGQDVGRTGSTWRGSVERANVEANKAANMNAKEDASASFAFTRKCASVSNDVIQVAMGACRMC